jgi:uncharacterized membrane protein
MNNLKVTRNKLDKLFLLTWRKAWIIVVAGFVSILLHNAIYAIFKSYYDARGGDEAFFLIVVIIVIPIYVLVVLIYSLIRRIKQFR